MKDAARRWMRCLDRVAWWLAWVALAILAALYVGLHIPCALLILATRDDCAASRWLHDSTDWVLDGIWKICPANARAMASGAPESPLE